jgi:hypothetical protein
VILRPWRGRSPAKHDCGEHGELTAGQIARVAGISVNSVHQRIRSGVRGTALCAPKMQPRRRHGQSYLLQIAPSGAKASLFLALRIVRLYGSRPPTVESLRSEFGMCRATAYRWRRAWLDAHGVHE